MEIVSYVRVSTTSQGASGLGLEAQRACVEGYATKNEANIVREFTEIESGKKSDRPVLAQAIAFAKRRKAKLVVAKLDRLSRNVAFLANLMETKVKFVACDIPEANDLTIYVMIAFAQQEADAISARTVAALAAKKARGGKLGADLPTAKPLSDESRAQGQAAGQAANRKNAVKAYADLLPIMRAMQANGMTLREIAAALNADGETTRTGAAWGSVQVMRALKRAE